MHASSLFPYFPPNVYSLISDQYTQEPAYFFIAEPFALLVVIVGLSYDHFSLLTFEITLFNFLF